jgi:3-oxoacyl-[acyl-carrier protein] reductase
MHTFLITGANSDIGIAVIRQILKSGGRVIGIHRSLSEDLSRIKKENQSSVELLEVDFLERRRVDWFLNEISNNRHDIDSLITLAALRVEIPYGELSRDQLVQHFEVNVVSPVLITQAVIKGMRKKKWGRILIGSSIGVKFGGGTSTFPYSLTKHCSEFVPNSARKWAKDNVLYNVLRIGFTDTSTMRAGDPNSFESREALIPMARAANVEEIAHTIYWLASDQNTYITMQTISVAGGE